MLRQFITRYLYTTSSDPDNAIILETAESASEAALDWLRGNNEPNENLDALIRQSIQRDLTNNSDGWTAQFPNSIEYVAIRAINLPYLT